MLFKKKATILNRKVFLSNGPNCWNSILKSQIEQHPNNSTENILHIHNNILFSSSVVIAIVSLKKTNIQDLSSIPFLCDHVKFRMKCDNLLPLLPMSLRGSAIVQIA